MRTSKGYLLRTYYDKGISYHNLCFVRDSKADRGMGELYTGVLMSLYYSLNITLVRKDRQPHCSSVISKALGKLLELLQSPGILFSKSLIPCTK